MSIRYAVVNTAATPDGNESKAADIIGLVTNPTSRISTGQLVDSAFRNTSVGLIAVITAASVLFVSEAEGSADYGTLASQLSDWTPTGEEVDNFTALETSTKTKAVEHAVVDIDVDGSVTGVTKISEMLDVVKPVAPIYTISSLVQKIESQLKEGEYTDYCILVSQDTERVAVGIGTGIGAGTIAAVGTEGMEIVYQYDANQSAPSIGEDGSLAQGWE